MCKEITIEGISYKNIKIAADAYGLTYSRVYTRMSRGWTIEQVFDIEQRHDTAKTIQGRVYIIRNNINKKVYIGATIHNINRRFREHKRSVIFKHNKLYQAMRELGTENFWVELLERTTTRKKLAKLEREYIDLYNSFISGYNSTKGGDGIEYFHGKAIAYEDKTYTSLSELAKSFCLDTHVVKYRLNNGIPLNAKLMEKVKMTIEGVEYTSLSQISNIFNIDRKTIRNRIAKGLSGKAIIVPGYKQQREQLNE